MNARRHPIQRRVDPTALVPGEPVTVLRVGKVFGIDGVELDGNVTSQAQLLEMVTHFERTQRPTGDFPLIDFDHAAVGPLSFAAHPARSIPLGAIIELRVDGDSLVATPAWTRKGREIVETAQGLLYWSATYLLGDVHDRATGERSAGAALLAAAVTPNPATRQDQLGAVRSRPFTFSELQLVPFGVVYPLPAEVARAWPAVGEDSPARPHVTVLYVLIAPSSMPAATEAVRSLAATTQPFGLQITGGVHTFEPAESEPRPVVAAVQSEGVLQLHRALLGALRAAGVAYQETHPGYVPHATLGYASTDVEVPAVQPAELEVDGLEIWAGDGEPVAVAFEAQDAQPAAGPATGGAMDIEALLAAAAGLKPEDKAKLMAALGGGEARSDTAAAATPAGGPAAIEEALRSALENHPAIKALKDGAARAAEAEAQAEVNHMIARGKILAAEGELALFYRSNKPEKFKAMADRPDGFASVSSSIIGEAGAPASALPAVPPTTRNGWADYVKRSMSKDEKFPEAHERLKARFPAQYRAMVAAGRKGAA